MRVFRLLVAGCAVALGLSLSAQTTDKAVAERARAKLEAMVQRPLLSPVPATPLRTTISDTEINAFFREYAHEQLPAGVSALRVTLLDGKFETRALIDFDLIRKAQSRGWLDPLAYVSGLMELTTTGAFSGSGGKGVLALESGSLKGVPIPRSVLKEVVTFFTRSPEFPNGLTEHEPFVLPSGIREVQLRKGSATVVQ